MITKEKYFDLLTKSLSYFFKEMYGDELEEFVWILKKCFVTRSHCYSKSVKDILKCYHSNKSSLGYLLHGVMYFFGFYRKEFELL